MDSDVTRTSRVLKILRWLSRQKPLTTREIQGRLGGKISLRSIQRDLRTLIETGFPMIIGKGEGNEQTWTLDSRIIRALPTLLGVDEYLMAQVLKSGLQIFRGTSFQTEIDTLISKIDEIAPDVALDIDEMSSFDIFESIPFGEVDYTDFKDRLNSLIIAVRGKHPCLVTYKSRRSSAPKSYRITPVRILYHKGALYVAAYRHKHQRYNIFAIDRFVEIDVSEDVETALPEFDLDEIRHRQFGLMPVDRLRDVSLRFDKYAAPMIKHRRWHTSQTITKKRGGGLQLNMMVGLSPDLESWILRWIPHVKVISPKQLRDNISGKLKAGLDSF